MAKGKRVSNKPGGDPGRRSRNGRERHLSNLARLRVQATNISSFGGNTFVPPSPALAPKRVPGPTRSSVLGRLVAPIRRFFRAR